MRVYLVPPDNLNTKRKAQRYPALQGHLFLIFVFAAGLIVSEISRKVQSGFRPRKPEYIPDALYALMLRCWYPDCCLRPTLRGVQVYGRFVSFVVFMHNIKTEGSNRTKKTFFNSETILQSVLDEFVAQEAAPRHQTTLTPLRGKRWHFSHVLCGHAAGSPSLLRCSSSLPSTFPTICKLQECHCA